MHSLSFYQCPHVNLQPVSYYLGWNLPWLENLDEYSPHQTPSGTQSTCAQGFEPENCQLWDLLPWNRCRAQLYTKWQAEMNAVSAHFCWILRARLCSAKGRTQDFLLIRHTFWAPEEIGTTQYLCACLFAHFQDVFGGCFASLWQPTRWCKT